MIEGRSRIRSLQSLQRAVSRTLNLAEPLFPPPHAFQAASATLAVKSERWEEIELYIPAPLRRWTQAGEEIRGSAPHFPSAPSDILLAISEVRFDFPALADLDRDPLQHEGSAGTRSSAGLPSARNALALVREKAYDPRALRGIKGGSSEIFYE